MDPPDRGDLGSGGLPLTSGAPLLGSGLSLSRHEARGQPHIFMAQADISSAVSAALDANTVFANLSYADKLRITGGLLSKPAYNHQHSLSIYVASEDADTTKIHDHLNLTHKLAVAPYTPSPGGAFNSAWFKQLNSGPVIVPPSALLLALSQSLVTLLDVSCLVIDDVHTIALDDPSTPLMTIILEYYGPLLASDRPRILGLTRYPLHVATNFGYTALRIEQLLDARVFGQLDARRAELKQAVDRLTVSILDYPVLQPCTNPAVSPAGQYHASDSASRLYEIGVCCYPLLAYFSVDSVLQSMTPNNMFSGLPAPNFCKEFLSELSYSVIERCTPVSGTSSKLDNFLRFIQTVSQTDNYRCIVIGATFAI
ncbi:hypothetical protein FRC06_010117 [Ceratobasidium sp. 370]|nr:hypothetical protein FRC06_010117 [Ceratobasidium sp. 370]